MPELPEVEVVRRGLDVHARGRTIKDVTVFDERVVVGAPQRWREAIVGCRITTVARRGKFLWLGMGEQAAVIHLGMSGQVLVGTPRRPPRHCRVRLRMSDGGVLDYVDQRMFGRLSVSPYEATLDGKAGGVGELEARVPHLVAHIGRDYLDPHLARQEWKRALAASRRPIKAVLLDQHLASGLGNIYADETLFSARVHPLTYARELSTRTLNRILACARDVMSSALAAGGTSFDSLYVDVDGHPGYFQRSLACYGREGEPCVRCASPIRRIVIQGRSTHLCARCQRRAR